MAKAISIKQPWAWAILNCGKGVENRKWRTNYRGRVIVHAGQSIDPIGVKFLQDRGIDVPKDLPTGCLLGEVEIVDCVPVEAMAGNPWAFGPFCWILKNPVVFEQPMPWKGALSFFEVQI